MLLELLNHHTELINNILDHLVATTCRPFTLMVACKELYAAVLAHSWAQHAAKMRSSVAAIAAINVYIGNNYKFIEFNGSVHLYTDRDHLIIINSRIRTVESQDGHLIRRARMPGSGYLQHMPTDNISPDWLKNYNYIMHDRRGILFSATRLY
jgi:hypothetical protein